MRTIALRFAEKFAPNNGTISAHNEVISSLGYVWYGKLCKSISKRVVSDILKNKQPRILLIHSGKLERYWAYIEEISFQTPAEEGIPEYYRNMSDKFMVWFRVVRFIEAPRDIMSKCIVPSSGSRLSEASKYSMSPYFIIDVDIE